MLLSISAICELGNSYGTPRGSQNSLSIISTAFTEIQFAICSQQIWLTWLWRCQIEDNSFNHKGGGCGQNMIFHPARIHLASAKE